MTATILETIFFCVILINAALFKKNHRIESQILKKC